jgi:hypothetical protein
MIFPVLHAVMQKRYVIGSMLVILVTLSLGLLVPATFAQPAQTLKVQAIPSTIVSLIPGLGYNSVQLSVQISAVNGGFASTSYAVLVKVTAPSGAGGPFCETVTIKSHGGNGRATVEYPGTFLASACSPAGAGGPSTAVPGTYAVTVSSTPAITTGTLSTTFTVQFPQNAASGTGTLSSQASGTSTFISAPESTATSPLFVSCNGTTTSPTTTTAPYYITQVGSTEITGVITSNTPGQFQSHVLRDPCSPSATSTFVSIYTNIWDYTNVTVTMPDGAKVTGGLEITQPGGATSLTTSGTTVGFGQAQMEYTGTGGLLGVTGYGSEMGTTITTSSGVTSFNVYTAELTGLA